MGGPSPVAPVFASLAILAGLALLYLRQRDRRRHDLIARYGVALGWALIAAGLIGWAMSGAADVGVSLGATLLCCAALIAVAARGLRTPAPARAPRARGESDRAESDGDELDLGRGYRSRVIARLTGAVVAAPAFGLTAGVLWRALVPGDAADRLIGMAFVIVIATAAAWVAQLASLRPWRVCAGLALAAAVMAVPVYLPMALRA